MATGIPSRAVACAALIAAFGACRDRPAVDPEGMAGIEETHRLRPGVLEIVTGTVAHVDEERVEIAADAGDRIAFRVHDGIIVTQEGRAVGIEALREGQPVRATYGPAFPGDRRTELLRVEIDPDPALRRTDPAASPVQPPVVPVPR
jgi:hypothetical protein